MFYTVCVFLLALFLGAGWGVTGIPSDFQQWFGCILGHIGLVWFVLLWLNDKEKRF